jgi:hypothetical protein
MSNIIILKSFSVSLMMWAYGFQIKWFIHAYTIDIHTRAYTFLQIHMTRNKNKIDMKQVYGIEFCSFLTAWLTFSCCVFLASSEWLSMTTRLILSFPLAVCCLGCLFINPTKENIEQDIQDVAEYYRHKVDIFKKEEAERMDRVDRKPNGHRKNCSCSTCWPDKDISAMAEYYRYKMNIGLKEEAYKRGGVD